MTTCHYIPTGNRSVEIRNGRRHRRLAPRANGFVEDGSCNRPATHEVVALLLGSVVYKPMTAACRSHAAACCRFYAHVENVNGRLMIALRLVPA